ncbi:MAG: DUF2934 domain-containing protein [Bryobacterales bacterium]|nr:DUF2934 domain-containing protein [Bryobacterales bacterium]
MPRKSNTKNGEGTEGTPVRRTRTRKAAAVTAANGGVKSQASPPEIPREEIEKLAYFYWLERGGQGGSPEDDWFRAEAELRRRYGIEQ